MIMQGTDKRTRTEFSARSQFCSYLDINIITFYRFKVNKQTCPFAHIAPKFDVGFCALSTNFNFERKNKQTERTFSAHPVVWFVFYLETASIVRSSNWSASPTNRSTSPFMFSISFFGDAAASALSAESILSAPNILLSELVASATPSV